jgi:hypothetical protein
MGVSTLAEVGVLSGRWDAGDERPGRVEFEHRSVQRAHSDHERASRGLLLSQTSRTIRPLELALDMALQHVANYRTRIA